jgi:hypothetical protein
LAEFLAAFLAYFKICVFALVGVLARAFALNSGFEARYAYAFRSGLARERRPF